MAASRGEIWMANLNPTLGSEQAGVRPVLVLQNDRVSRYTSTVLAVPLTTNLRGEHLPSCLRVPAAEGGLVSDSVLLGHQLRVLDQRRLLRRMGTVSRQTMAGLEIRVLFTLGMVGNIPERPTET